MGASGDNRTQDAKRKARPLSMSIFPASNELEKMNMGEEYLSAKAGALHQSLHIPEQVECSMWNIARKMGELSLLWALRICPGAKFGQF